MPVDRAGRRSRVAKLCVAADGPPARKREAALASKAVPKRGIRIPRPAKSAGYMVTAALTPRWHPPDLRRVRPIATFAAANLTRSCMHSQSTAPWTHGHAFLGVRHDEHERRAWGVVALTAA